MENLKQLAKTIEGKLTSKDAFKAIHGGGFLGGKAKKSFAVWSAAEKKAVLPLYLLQDYVHQDDDSDNYYGIYAFSTKSEIDTDTLARLKAAAQEIDLETVRYEGIGYTRLELWRSAGESFAQVNNSIANSLSDVANGLYVYATGIGFDNKNWLDQPLVIYAHHDGGDYIYPIEKAKLSKI